MKHVCISLAAALALAVPSFAQSAEETPFSCEVRTKYNQPGTPYSSLAEAVAAVPADGKIHYVSVIGEGPAEITTPITVTAGQNISLYSEKSGITYDIPASLTAPVFTVESGARLTFTRNGTYVYGEGVQGTFLENYGYVSLANGTFTLDAGDSDATFINHGGAEDNSMKCGATVTVASGTAFRNDGVLTISSGTTTAESGIAVLSNGGTLTLSTSKGVTGSEGAIVVNGGVAKFTKGSYASTSAAPAVRLCAAAAPIEAVFSSSSVTLTAAGGDALEIADSAQVCKVQINRGTFTPAEGKASIRVTHDTENADVTLSVVDGVFNAPIVSEGSAPVGGFILGGSFFAQPDAALVADGLSFEQNDDGFYAPTAVAQIGEATYLTFKDAISAATPGDTVKLLRDVSIPESTPITVYGLTVDLGGHTLINTATGGSGIRLTFANAEGAPADFTLVGPGAIVADTPIYASGAYNYARPYAVVVDEDIRLTSTAEGNPLIELSGSARIAATEANVKALGKGGFKVNDGSAEWLYGTCAGAFLNVPEGGTFTLCQDFKGSSRLEFPIDPTLLQTRATGIVKSATLDLAGHAFTSTLDGNNADLIVIDSGADVTIKGGSLTAIGDLAHMALPEDNNGNAALTLEDVTATSSSDDYLIVSNGSTDNINITVRDSTLTATGANTVAIFAPAGGDSIVTLDNAIIKSPYGVQVCAGDLFVKGNTQITTTAANVASTKTGDGPIPDGAAISIVDRAGYGDDATTGSSIGTVTIKGTPTLIAQGEGASAVAAYTWNDNTQSDWAEASEHVTISGGTFSQKPDTDLLDPDFVLVENQDGTFDVASAYVASIGDVKYASLQEAFDAATEGQTVTLIADVDCSGTGVKVRKTVTFDLNGRTLSLANIGTGNLNIAAGATLTLVDSTDTEKKGTGSGKIVATHDYAAGYGYGIINVSDGAAFVMESGLIDTVREDPVNKGQFGVMVAGTGKATINGGHIRAGWYAIAGNGNDKTDPGTTIAVNGGILESTADYAIYHPQAGTLSIAGGTVAGAAGGLSINRGSATITGGTVTSKGTGDTGDWGDGTSGQGNAAIIVGAKYGDVALAISGDAVITAPDGIPAISVPESDKAQAIAISGGTFSEKPDNAWFADGFIPVENADGTFEVAPGSFAAEIAGEKYLTLKEAIAAVPENGAEATTIMLLDDVTSAGSLTLTNGQKAILNMNGKTVTFTSGKLQLLTSASLTLTGEGALVCQSRGTGAISIYGNETSQIDLLVDSGVTVDGHYGIALFGNGSPACRNVTVTVKGTVKTSEGGSALYVNGTVNNTEGSVPQIILAEGAKVEAASIGIYAAGYAKWDLAGTINAGNDAISVKSGTFNITGGSYTANGPYVECPVANSNGTEHVGAAIGITTNGDYAKPIVVNITGGDFISTNGYALYEGIAKTSDGTPAAEASAAVIAIQGGDFTGNADLGADIAVTTAENKQVVSGGTFSQPVALAYCAPGYAPKQNTDGTYSVVGWYETGVDKNNDGVADAWTIRNEGDLAAFRDKVNSTVTFAGCTVTLTADLDLSDMGTWIPIGEGNAGGASKNGGFFAGTFEGGNYLIANLHVSETKLGEGAGLFGWVRGATIRNLRVSGSILANVNGAAGIIGVVESNYDGNARTVIENVHNEGDTVRGSKAGGIVGDIRRGGTVSITNCTNAAAVTAFINHSDTAGVLCAGGIVGNAGGTSVTIDDCTNKGTVTATPDDEGLTKQTPTYAGGIVGRMGTGSIAAGNGNNTGTVSATGAGTAGQGAILGGVVAGTQPFLALALTEADAEAGRVALFTAAEVVPEGLTVKVPPAEGASAPAGTVLAVDDGTLYCNLLYLDNRVAGESEGETFNAAAQEALLAAAGNTLYGTIAVTGTTAVDKALTTAQVNEVLACFEGEGLITASESEGVKTLVVAYDFGITGLRVTAEGDLVVTVAAQDAQAQPLAFAEGVALSLHNGEAALEATSATVDGVTTLTVQAANLPAGNLKLAVSVAPAAEAETPAE